MFSRKYVYSHNITTLQVGMKVALAVTVQKLYTTVCPLKVGDSNIRSDTAIGAQVIFIIIGSTAPYPHVFYYGLKYVLGLMEISIRYISQ